MTEALHIVCPGCNTVNRVARERPADAAHCGKCKANLFEGKPVAVTSQTFELHRQRDDVPVLVDVWAPWCGPCRSMAPMFERAAQELEPNFRLLKLNADEAPEISRRYGIRGIPTLLLFKNGQLAAQTAGAMDTTRIVNWARSNL
ncbi:MAG: thioredoxin TrxC [Alphaproteobacteria bacterium]|mgnify:CR=1 FL=1|nr:thioredoxin TrxC [Alphaproteobacteria bacterium]